MAEYATYRRSPLILPKLKAKTELLQALPALRKYFPDAASAASLERKGSASRRSPADDSDDEGKEIARMQVELKRVKKERAALLQTLAAVRASSRERPVGDLQAQDIAALRTSLTEKQKILNELREKNAELEETIEGLSVRSRDCGLLIPEPGGGAAGDIANRLTATLAEIETEAKVIETRTVQYQLLADRTGKDRDTAERRIRAARELKAAAEDDRHTLNQHFYELNAAKEAAERALGAAVAQYDEMKNEWQRKLRSRRREVKVVERRLAEEAAEQAQQAKHAAVEAARISKEHETVKARDHAAVAEANNPAVLAKLQLAEETWSRLLAVAGGASTPQEVISAWQDLTERSQALQDLLTLTCQQEDRLRNEQTELQYLLQESEREAQDMLGGGGGDTFSGGVGKKESHARQQEHQQRLHQLENLCAAAELGLATIQEKLGEAQEYNPEAWSKVKTPQPVHNEHHRRSSAAQRRASVAPPRRVSAIDLANIRGAHGPRRGSIAVPLNEPPLQRASAADSCSLQDEVPGTSSSGSGSSTGGVFFFSELPAIAADVAKKVDKLLSIVEQNSATTVVVESAAKSPSGYKRGTLVGPEWVEMNVCRSEKVVEATAGEQGSAAKQVDNEEDTAGKTAAAAVFQPQPLPAHAVEAADRYMKRLVGVTVEPAVEHEDPFALLQSSDDDEQTIMDRNAVKHRSRKITHPKRPKGEKLVAAAKSPGGLTSATPIAGSPALKQP